MTAWILGVGVPLVIIAIHHEAMRFARWFWHHVDTSNSALLMFAVTLLYFVHLA